MCGIAGLVCVDRACGGKDHEAIVEAMCDAQAHRGPDDSGVVSLGPVTLGSRRLSIIDLSPAGHMPMGDETGRWWITYNGETYNFEEIREDLEKLGHTFKSRTDTEVVLKAFIQWGEACLDRLVGMFAFALLDTETGELVLVRDRYGIKPLYYTRAGGHILFGSEIKALLPWRPTLDVDKHSLMEWLLYRNVDVLTPETLVEGVSSVLPGEMVTIRDGECTRRPYYSPLEPVSEPEYRRFAAAGPEDLIGEIGTTLEEAVRARLVSDVPVGTLLSGGLDSSLITALAAEHRNNRDLTAFHVSVAGFPDLDESRHAKHLAQSLGLKLVSHALTGDDFRARLPHVIRLSDMPLTHPNSVAYHMISRVAREHGVTVLLSGEGADELFGGYRWMYRRKQLLLRLEPFLRLIPKRIHDILAILVYANAGLPVPGHRLRESLPPTVDFADRYARKEWTESCTAAYAFVGSRNDRAVLGAMLADLGDFLVPLLRRLDRTTMGASVECRVPFLDHRLVHKVVNLPLSYRVGRRTDKWILKQVAAGHIPEDLIRRRKMGFPLPLGDYLRPLADRALFAGGFCETVLRLDRRGIARLVDSSENRVFGFFGLLTLECWGRMFLMGESAEQVAERFARIAHGRTGT